MAAVTGFAQAVTFQRVSSIVGGRVQRRGSATQVLPPAAVVPAVLVVSTPTDADGAIVVEVTDPNPGMAYTGVFAVVPGSNGREDVVYRRGVFKYPYIARSYVVALDALGGVRLHIYRTGGWPVGTTAFTTDAVDAGGSVAP